MDLNPIAIGLSGLGGIVGAAGAAAEAKRKRKFWEPRLLEAEGAMKTGITGADLAGVQGNIMAGLRPQINAVASRYSARLGASGYAKGAGLVMAFRALAPQMARLQELRLTNNQANKRLMYGSAASGLA